jgi:FkbM family methyltransferase
LVSPADEVPFTPDLHRYPVTGSRQNVRLRVNPWGKSRGALALQLENVTTPVRTFLRRMRRKKTRAGTAPAGSFYRPFADCQVRGLDAIYNAAFGHLKQGVFVEVGAYDGQAFSNTCFLADLGWRGLYVEPVPDFAAACAKRHRDNPGVAIVNTAVGGAAGETELHVAGAMTTKNDDVYCAYQNLPWAKGALSGRTVTAAVTTLDRLLEERGIPAGFELLVVDVEGCEPEVFAGFDLARWKPKMLIVELADRHPDFIALECIRAAAAGVRRQILEAGYTEAYIDSINTVFRLGP